MVVRNLSYKNILKQIDFALESGKITCLIGENGSGKSTLIKCLSGYLSSDLTGEILINNKNIKSLSSFDLYNKRAVLTQHNTLTISMLCEDYILLAVQQNHLNPSIKIFFDELISYFNIEHLLKADFLHCSGGEQQRINLVRVFLQALSNNNQPYFIFLDEPFNFLDIKYIPLVSNYLQKLKWMGFSIFMSIHDINLAYNVCDAVLMLRNGKLVCTGAKELFTTENLNSTFGVEFEEYTMQGKTLFSLKTPSVKS